MSRYKITIENTNTNEKYIYEVDSCTHKSSTEVRYDGDVVESIAIKGYAKTHYDEYVESDPNCSYENLRDQLETPTFVEVMD